MNAIGIVFSAEFLRRITSRAYIIATIIGALSIVAIAVLPKLLAGGFAGSTTTLVLVGDPALTAAARPLLAGDYKIAATFARLDRTPDTAFLDAHGKATAVTVLTRDRTGLRVTAYARDPSEFHGGFARHLLPLQVALGTGLPVAAVQRHLDGTGRGARRRGPLRRRLGGRCGQGHRLPVRLSALPGDPAQRAVHHGLGGRGEDQPHRRAAGRDDRPGPAADRQDSRPRRRPA